jgi:hypothetical protein
MKLAWTLVRVLFAVLVTSRAMRRLGRERRGRNAAKHVVPVGTRNKMIRPHAPPNPAPVIQFESRRNRTDKNLISKHMGEGEPPRAIRARADDHVGVPVRIQRRGPEPAT